MKEMSIRDLSFVTVLTLLLAGCTTGNVRDDGSELNTVEEKGPGDVYVGLGTEYMRQGKPAVALQKLQQGLAVDPNNAQLHNVLAILYERLGENARAREHYARAIALAPKDPYIHNAWGSFLCKQGEFAHAESQFELALKNPLYTTPWITLTNAGICARRAGDPGEAETYFRRALSVNPEYPAALRQMARISFRNGNYLSTRAYLERYSGVAAHTPETLWLGIRTERKLGNRDALASYELVLRRKFPDAPEVQLLNETPQP